MYEATVSHFAVKLDGNRAPERLMRDMLECIVENSLHLPDMCTIRIHDAEFHWLDTETFEAGTRVEILAGMEGMGELKSIFVGEVVAEEVDMAAQGLPTLMIRCFDKSHRLHRGRKQRSFQNTTDSDIVKRVAAEYGFKLVIDGTSVVHDWVFQNNQTDWEFLQDRAARCGHEIYVAEQNVLHFTKVDSESASKHVELKWGLELRSFRVRTTPTTQVNEVIVKGWNPDTKRAIIGKSKAPKGTPKTLQGGEGGSVASHAFNDAKMYVVDRPVQSEQEANDLARSIMDTIGNSFLEADGMCYGRPELRPGVWLEIKNIGKKYSGKYKVTETTHTYTPAEGYSTLFSINGKRSLSLLGSGQGESQIGRTRLGGNIVIALVTDNNDSTGLGRVKVVYPWLTEDHTSHWARMVSQMAGSGRGMFNTPEIGDEVLVAFEHGDIHRPFILGMLWNGVDKLPSFTAGANSNPMLGGSSEVNRRGLYSRIGHIIETDDTGGEGSVRVHSSNGRKIVVNDAEKHIEASTPSGHGIKVCDVTKTVTLFTSGGG